jgi:uncharacterized LabA/DUF88 family protein
MLSVSPQGQRPESCRAIVFIDGQNLTRSAERAFGGRHRHPLFDPLKLADFVCRNQGANLAGIYFYTGIPPIDRDPFWHAFWSRKKTQMMRRGIVCRTRAVKYRPHRLKLPDGTFHDSLVAEEKGIDVWLAVELVGLARDRAYDLAIVFSQDQDLCPAVEEVKKTAQAQSRWIKVVSAYPVGSSPANAFGIHGTDFLRIGQSDYESCVDPYDYVSRASEDARNSRR